MILLNNELLMIVFFAASNGADHPNHPDNYEVPVCHGATAKDQLFGARHRTISAAVDGPRGQKTRRTHNTHFGRYLHVPGPRDSLRRLLRVEPGQDLRR